jgi:hypothetical protein
MGWIYCLLLKTSQDSWTTLVTQKSEMGGTRLTHGTCVYTIAYAPDNMSWNVVKWWNQQFFTIGVQCNGRTKAVQIISIF